MTKGYTDLLRPHLETMARLAQKYSNPSRPNRVEWLQALKDEPALCDTLLVGDGPQTEQIKRISAVWMRLKPGGLDSRPKRQGNRTPQSQRTAQRNFKGTQSLCSRLDDHRPVLEEMARANSNALGRVSWVAALAASPDVADAIGYSDLDEEGRRKMINVLGFWYRTRAKPGQAGKPARAQRNGPATEVQAAAPAARFCPRCGEDIGAHALASGIVASMSASGLSPTQIMQTLTQAANTVSKLSQ